MLARLQRRALVSFAQRQQQQLVATGRRYHRPSAPSGPETQALLRELERVLREDPAVAGRLGALLSPATSRNLSYALSNVQKAQRRRAADDATAFSPAAAAAVNQAQQQLQNSSVAAATAAGGVTAAAPATVSLQDLQYVALQVGLPFIGFGFVDNAIMILAGDYIDLTLGVTLGISSMAAAALGNTISDIAGLGLGNVVEDMCARLGLPTPVLTQEQVRRRPVEGSLGRRKESTLLAAPTRTSLTPICLLSFTPSLSIHSSCSSRRAGRRSWGAPSA